MSLTTGKGPLSPGRSGRFNVAIPEGVVYVEPFQRRVRAERSGVTVVDSERVLLVHRPGQSPAYAFPAGDVTGVPATSVEEAAGYVQVAWDAADTWFEEQEEVFFHPRNPYHRVDVLRTDRRLRAEVDGAVLADTADTVGVYETSHPPRLYVSPEQVRRDLLVPSDTTTYCPYKGTASYWSAVVDGQVHPDVAWSYEDPLPESLPIKGLLSFDGARLRLQADVPAPAAV